MRRIGFFDLSRRLPFESPECSINFLTCHDGFTLNDLVSFRHKHNRANGEDNRDGADENFSENYGVEGGTDDPRIESLRKPQIRNFLPTLFVSRGVPMLLGGDEFRRTQRGNNNAYCQDNDISWYDWCYLTQHEDIYRFTRDMIALRRAHPTLAREQFYTDAEISWFNASRGTPDWADPHARQLACLIHDGTCDPLYLMFNAGAEAAAFQVPDPTAGRTWYVAADTYRDSSPSLFASGHGLVHDAKSPYLVESRSSALLTVYQRDGDLPVGAGGIDHS